MTKTTKSIPAVEPRWDPNTFADEARRRRRVARERARARLVTAIWLASDGLALVTTSRALMSATRLRPYALSKTLWALARDGDVIVLRRDWPDPALLFLLMDHPAAAPTARAALAASWAVDRMSEAWWAKCEAAMASDRGT